jgi:hypothetical protein
VLDSRPSARNPWISAAFSLFHPPGVEAQSVTEADRRNKALAGRRARQAHPTRRSARSTAATGAMSAACRSAGERVRKCFL